MAPNPHPQVSTAIIEPLPREAKQKPPNISIEVIHKSSWFQFGAFQVYELKIIFFSQNSPFPPLTSVSTNSGRE